MCTEYYSLFAYIIVQDVLLYGFWIIYKFSKSQTWNLWKINLRNPLRAFENEMFLLTYVCIFHFENLTKSCHVLKKVMQQNKKIFLFLKIWPRKRCDVEKKNCIKKLIFKLNFRFQDSLMSPYSSTTRSQSQSPRNSPQMRYRSMSSRPVLPTSNARPTAAAPVGKQQPSNYTNFNFQGLTNRRYNNNNDSPGTPQRSRQTANLLARLVLY